MTETAPASPTERAATKGRTVRVRRGNDPARLPLAWTGKGRTREGELYRRVVRDLTAHVGGKPSGAERLLIGRIAWLQVHLAAIDERAMRDGALSPHATREYLAWANSLAKLIGRLGMKGVPQRAPTLADYLAARAAKPAPAASAVGPVSSPAATPQAAQRAADGPDAAR